MYIIAKYQVWYEKIDEWHKMNEVKLNENQIKIMEINLNSEEIFKVNDTVIEKVAYIEYLGFNNR